MSVHIHDLIDLSFAPRNAGVEVAPYARRWLIVAHCFEELWEGLKRPGTPTSPLGTTHLAIMSPPSVQWSSLAWMFVQPLLLYRPTSPAADQPANSPASGQTGDDVSADLLPRAPLPIRTAPEPPLESSPATSQGGRGRPGKDTSQRPTDPAPPSSSPMSSLAGEATPSSTPASKRRHSKSNTHQDLPTKRPRGRPKGWRRQPPSSTPPECAAPSQNDGQHKAVSPLASKSTLFNYFPRT